MLFLCLVACLGDKCSQGAHYGKESEQDVLLAEQCDYTYFKISNVGLEIAQITLKYMKKYIF